MSRLVRVVDETVRGFPRVSGDEPHRAEFVLDKLSFSPRERG